MGENQKPHNLLWKGIAWGCLAAVFLVPALLFGPHVVDDAFITFRYARNLSLGRGVVYNPGERVQGSSTPLFTLILGAMGTLGIDISKAALGLGFLAGFATLVLLVRGGSILGRERAGWLAATALSTQLVWVLLLVSGMETALYTMIVMATLFTVSLEKWKWTGPLCALACLVRYDGAILVVSVLTILVWRAGIKLAIREAIKTAIIYTPWFLFACLYFGNPFPQSVKAKLIIDPLSWKGLFLQYALLLEFVPQWGFWLVLAVWGMIRAARRNPPRLIFPLWCGLYLLIFILGKRAVFFYPWYLVPLFPPILLLGAWGLFDGLQGISLFLRKKSRRLHLQHPDRVAMLIGSAILVFQVIHVAGWYGDMGNPGFHREKKYEVAAGIIGDLVKPGESIYVGEVGTIGWHLPDNYIIDSAGLLSPRVTEIRRLDRENLVRLGKNPLHYPDGTTSVTLMAIEEFKPDYISSAKGFLFLDELKDEPSFRRRYEMISHPRLEVVDQYLFRRKR